LQPPPRRVPPGIVLGAAGFCTNISWQVVLPVLPVHLARLGYSAAQIGVMVSALSITMAAVELQAGPIGSAVGRRFALIGAYAANGACLVLAGAARTAPAVVLALAGIGGARGVLIPPLHATVAEASTAAMRGRMFGVFWFWASAATLAGPLLGGFVAAKYGDRAPFYAGAALSALAIPMIARVAAPRHGSPRVSLREIPDAFSVPALVRLCATTLLCFGMAGVWTTYLPLHIARQGLSIVVVGWVFALQGLVYMLMQLPAGRLITRLRGDRLALIGIAGMAGAVLVVPLIRTPPALLAAGAVYGFGFGLIPVTLATRITWLIAPEKLTTAMGMYNSAIDFGLFLGPLLGGALVAFSSMPPFSLALPFGIAASVMALGSTPRAEAARAQV